MLKWALIIVLVIFVLSINIIFVGFCGDGNSGPSRGYSKIFLTQPLVYQRRNDTNHSVCSIQFPTGE